MVRRVQVPPRSFRHDLLQQTPQVRSPAPRGSPPLAKPPDAPPDFKTQCHEPGMDVQMHEACR